MTTFQEKRLLANETRDYPRFTMTMTQALAGIRQFRDELERVRP